MVRGNRWEECKLVWQVYLGCFARTIVILLVPPVFFPPKNPQNNQSVKMQSFPFAHLAISAHVICLKKKRTKINLHISVENFEILPDAIKGVLWLLRATYHLNFEETKKTLHHCSRCVGCKQKGFTQRISLKGPILNPLLDLYFSSRTPQPHTVNYSKTLQSSRKRHI